MMLQLSSSVLLLSTRPPACTQRRERQRNSLACKDPQRTRKVCEKHAHIRETTRIYVNIGEDTRAYAKKRETAFVRIRDKKARGSAKGCRERLSTPAAQSDDTHAYMHEYPDVTYVIFKDVSTNGCVLGSGRSYAKIRAHRGSLPTPLSADTFCGARECAQMRFPVAGSGSLRKVRCLGSLR